MTPLERGQAASGKDAREAQMILNHTKTLASSFIPFSTRQKLNESFDRFARRRALPAEPCRGPVGVQVARDARRRSLLGSAEYCTIARVA